jgi:hypothetical protein
MKSLVKVILILVLFSVLNFSAGSTAVSYGGPDAPLCLPDEPCPYFANVVG